MPEDQNHWYIKVKHLIIMSLDSAKSGVYSEFSAPPLQYKMEMWLLHKIEYLLSNYFSWWCFRRWTSLHIKEVLITSHEWKYHLSHLCKKHYQLWRRYLFVHCFLLYEIPEDQIPLSYSKDCNLWFTITPTCLVQHEKNWYPFYLWKNTICFDIFILDQAVTAFHTALKPFALTE